MLCSPSLFFRTREIQQGLRRVKFDRTIESKLYRCPLGTSRGYDFLQKQMAQFVSFRQHHTTHTQMLLHCC